MTGVYAYFIKQKTGVDFMNKKVLRTLEFDKIVHRLAEHATSPGGKALCNHIEPLSDINKIKEMLWN